jgi:hypothetical protein
MYDYVTSQYESVKDNRRVQSLKIPELLAEAKAAKNEVLACVDRIDDVEAKDWNREKKDAEGKMEEFDLISAKLLKYSGSLEMATSKLKKIVTSEKRNLNARVARIAEKLCTNNFPAELATSIANVLDGYAKQEQALDTFVSSPYSLDYDGASSMHRVNFFNPDAVRSDLAPMLEELNRVYTTLCASKLSSYLKSANKAITESKRSHVSKAIPMLEPPFDANKGSSDQFDLEKNVGSLPMGFIVQKNNHYADDIDSCPLVMPMFITVMKGFAWIFFIDIQMFLDADIDIFDAKKLFAKMGDLGVGKVMQVGLKAGQSIYVPFGIIPYIVFMTPPKEIGSGSDADGDIGAYIMHCVLDDKCVRDKDASLKAEVMARLTRAMGRNLPIFGKGLGDSIKKWLERWPADVV